jgi:putative Ca2+/H+ antiporter (TMEM165/GDT1 family)
VIHSFLLATVAIVLAEMGDKTQLLAMAFAARFRWHTVLWAVCAATLVNHLMAVVVGNVVTQVLPLAWIKLAAAASFVIFALWTIRGDSLDGETQGGGRGPFWTVAIAFFIAEMGDKTQLMTIALAADEAVRIGGVGWTAKARQIVPVWMGTTCGMLIADAFGIVVGIGLHKHIPETAIKWIAALCFAGFGLLGLHEALDLLLPHDVTLHHAALIAASLAVPALMWFIARQSAERRSRSSAPEAADATDESRE